MTKAKTTANLKVRVGPGTNHRQIATLPKGTEIDVTRGGNGWAEIAGYVSEQFLTFEQPEPEPKSATKRGYHFLSGPRNFDAIGHIAQLAARGTPLAGVTVNMVDGARSIPAEIKAVSPQTVVVGRIYTGAEPDRQEWPSGHLWMMDRKNDVMAFPDVDYWQIANEWGVNSLAGKVDDHSAEKVEYVTSNFVRFYLEIIEWFKANGKKCVVGDFGVGQVEPWYEEKLYPLFAAAERAGMPINYHAYNGGPTTGLTETDMMNGAAWYAMRWLRWAKRFPDLLWVFGEAGAGSAQYTGSKERELAMMGQFDEMLSGRMEFEIDGVKVRPDPSKILYYAWWTLWPTYDWAYSDFSAALR